VPFNSADCPRYAAAQAEVGNEASRYAPGFHPLGMIRTYGYSILVQ